MLLELTQKFVGEILGNLKGNPLNLDMMYKETGQNSPDHIKFN